MEGLLVNLGWLLLMYIAERNGIMIPTAAWVLAWAVCGCKWLAGLNRALEAARAKKAAGELVELLAAHRNGSKEDDE